MKKYLLLFLFLGFFAGAQAQEKSYDTLAIVVVDHMSAIIGDLSSCSFRMDIETDLNDPTLGAVTKHSVNHVWFSGSDKLVVEAQGDRGHRGYWYNGKTLTWYSFTENNYVIIPVPNTTIAMMDSVNNTYGIDFPAADFFYPSLSDDLIEHSDYISFEGRTVIAGKSCFLVVSKNKEMNVQIWITDDVLFLPVKFIITYNNAKQEKRYEGTFSDWQINPALPDAMFDFALPPGAREVSILPRK